MASCEQRFLRLVGQPSGKTEVPGSLAKQGEEASALPTDAVWFKDVGFHTLPNVANLLEALLDI